VSLPWLTVDLVCRHVGEMWMFWLTVQIRNKDTAMCLDTFGRKAGEKVGMADCHGLGGNQV